MAALAAEHWEGEGRKYREHMYASRGMVRCMTGDDVEINSIKNRDSGSKSILKNKEADKRKAMQHSMFFKYV